MHKKQNRIDMNHDRTYTSHQVEGYLNEKLILMIEHFQYLHQVMMSIDL